MPDNIITEKGRQRWIIASLCFAGFMALFDQYVINISLPIIARDLHVKVDEVSRIILVYLLVLTGTILWFGKLADRIGLKKTICWGYLLFIFGSLLCGLSETLFFLLAARCIQAIGGAMLMASVPAVIPKYLPKEIRGSVFGVFTTVTSLGVTLGAPVGGLISTYLSWHWIFLINIPVGLVAIGMTLKFIPAADILPRPAENNGLQIDVPGIVLSFAGLFTFLLSLNLGEKYGWFSRTVFTAFMLGIILLVAFFRREKSCSNPLLDLTLFRDSQMVLANFSTLTGMMLICGHVFLFPFYLTLVKGLKPDKIGLMVLIYSGVYMVVSPMIGKLADRMSPAKLCCLGMISAMAACLFFSLTLAWEGYVYVVIFLVWLAISYAFFVTPKNDLIMSLAPPGKQGSVSAVLKVVSNLGCALGASLFMAIFFHFVGQGSLPQEAKMAPEILIRGFHYAYVFGAVCCLVSFLFSIQVKNAQSLGIIYEHLHEHLHDLLHPDVRHILTMIKETVTAIVPELQPVRALAEEFSTSIRSERTQ